MSTSMRARLEHRAGRATRRVLVSFHEADEPSGASLSILRIIPRLEAMGWEFRFWASRPSSLFELVRERGYPVDGRRLLLAYDRANLRHPPGARARIASLPGYFQAFRRYLRETAPALLHANGLTTVPEALVARSASVPAVLHLHEMLPANWVGTGLRLAASAGGLEVIAVSHASATAWARRAHPPRIVHECADVPEQLPPRTSSDGEIVVGTVGVVSRRKGSDLFVDTAERLMERAPHLRFRLVGPVLPDADQSWGRRLVERATASGIDYDEHVDDVWPLLRSWDIFVMPSRWDPFPIAVLEAMGAELPVVGTSVDGMIEQLGDGAGVLVPSEDPDALAKAIASLAGDEAGRRALGEAARRRVLHRFTLDAQARGIDDAYRAALAPAGNRGLTRV